MRTALSALVLAAAAAATASAATPQRPQGAPATCRHQSSFDFKKSGRDLRVGPLVLVNGREYSTPQTIATFGGQKYPAIVLAGRRVTIELPRAVRRTSLLYADDHWSQGDGERTVGDGHRVVAFRSCPSSRAGSSYDGRDATFWSGFVLTTVPRCLKLRVWVDDERRPRSARLPLGGRCT
jgi:hypothetical protein